MNNKHLWIASACGAVLTTLVSNLPFVGLINCLLCAGFWGSAIFAVWLYRRLSGNVTAREGIKIGFLTGICAGLLGFLLSFAGLAGIKGLMNNVNQFVPLDANSGINTAIITLGEIVTNLIGVLFNIFFGTIGGWIGGVFFKSEADTNNH